MPICCEVVTPSDENLLENLKMSVILTTVWGTSCHRKPVYC